MTDPRALAEEILKALDLSIWVHLQQRYPGPVETIERVLRAHQDAQLQELTDCQRERDEARDRVTRCSRQLSVQEARTAEWHVACDKAEASLAACVQERDHLEGALRKYGAHDRECGLCGLNIGDVCTCGLDDLLAALPPTSA